MKYCCQRFESYNRANNETYPNVRIVKFLPNLHCKKSYFRFFITHGYEKFNMDLVVMNIAYCPFCGKNLFDFYRKDIIPNEMEGTTFPKLPPHELQTLSKLDWFEKFRNWLGL